MLIYQQIVLKCLKLKLLVLIWEMFVKKLVEKASLKKVTFVLWYLLFIRAFSVNYQNLVIFILIWDVWHIYVCDILKRSWLYCRLVIILVSDELWSSKYRFLDLNWDPELLPRPDRRSILHSHFVWIHFFSLLWKSMKKREGLWVLIGGTIVNDE